MFPTQINAVFCLLHPMKPNHLAVIEQTVAGKTHILWMLGVIEWGIVLIFIPLLTLLADVMSKFTFAAERSGAQFQCWFDVDSRPPNPDHYSTTQCVCDFD
jgi:hypothetical protein